MKEYSSSLFIVLVAFITNCSSKFVCQGVGNFPNPENCETYYVCATDIEPVLMNCPVPLLFDPVFKICNNAESVKCSSTPETPSSTSPSTPTPTTPTPSTSRPTESTTNDPNQICPVHGTHRIANPMDCTSFYFCIDGNYRIVDCPTGYGFHPEGEDCRPLAEVKCNIQEPTPTSSPNQPTCPNTGSQVYPNKGDCFSFFLCDEGKSYLISCAVGMEYNSATGSCDTPANARCSNGGSTAPPTVSPCAGKPDGVTLPDPTDCSSFYQCSKGETVKQTCAPGLEFNAAVGVCDYPATANCSVKLFLVPL